MMRIARQSLLILLWCVLPAAAQAPDKPFEIPGLGQGFGTPKVSVATGPAVTASGKIVPGGEPNKATLYVTAETGPEYHIYSITQAAGGPVTSRIKLSPSKQFTLLDKFTSDDPPEVTRDWPGNPALAVEKHHGVVTWHAPLELASGVKLEDLKIEGAVYAQACEKETCLEPRDYPFTATFVKYQSVGTYVDKATHATISGRLDVKAAAPGETVRLLLTAKPAAKWHVYAREDVEPKEIGSRPTLIALVNSSGLTWKQATTDAKIVEKDGGAPGLRMQRYHEGEVTWTVELTVPQDAQPGTSSLISGVMGYQTCWEKGCDLPAAVQFEAVLPIAATTAKGEIPLGFNPDGYKNAAAAATQAAEMFAKSSPAAPIDFAALAVQLGLAFLAGLILNVMPCVLPVIGLKILSFVHQAGKSRSRVLLLNLWYVLGLMSVFMALATLAVVFHWGWAAQFQSATFNIVLIGVVFAFALAFLGVWEIPIPGFVGTGHVQELAAHEGALGAFLKGVLTTVLATPCVGPLFVPTFTWAVGQPPLVAYLVIGFIGVGMASPYIVIGFFPALVKKLPKPGPWMDTFKQVMGFVLLGTVVWLFNSLKTTPNLYVPTIALIFSIWAACWWVGRTPLYESTRVKFKAWFQGLAFATVASGAVFYLHLREELPWQPFAQAKLDRLLTEGKTVLVDFTADT